MSDPDVAVHLDPAARRLLRLDDIHRVACIDRDLWIAYVLRQDEQMANRFELLTLPRWQFEDLEYAKLLATFERQLPLWQASGLTDPELAQHILMMAGGLIGGIVALLRQAAAEAIRTGHERIDRPMLARANAASPERIEAVAHALDL